MRYQEKKKADFSLSYMLHDFDGIKVILVHRALLTNL